MSRERMMIARAPDRAAGPRTAAPRIGRPGVLRAGFIPLVDCASLVVAAAKGFAAEEGLVLELERETSWANVRDRLVLGHLDAAHMLAPMPVAANLGLGPLDVPMVAPMVLSLGGNAITVSTRLWRELGRSGEPDGPLAAGRALAAYVAARAARGTPPLTFAMVFPFSGHNYELRDWLAAAGIHPDRDVRLVVIPPPFMVDALAQGHVDGFCVGAPWNDLAVAAGVGRIVATKAALWPRCPEKVLGLRRGFAERHPERVDSLIRALARAARWADDPENRGELAALLAEPRHVGAPAESIARVLAGRLVTAPGGSMEEVPDYLVFHRGVANVPPERHALWLYAQMVRWGQVAHASERAEAARLTFRPDIYRRALRDPALPLAAGPDAIEPRPDRPTAAGDLAPATGGALDGHRFDPDALDAFIDGFAIHSRIGAGARPAG